MALLNLLIQPITGYTAEQRAAAISAELWAISRPPKVRQPQDVSAYLFGWIEHPTQDLAVLQGIDNYIIRVHPENDLSNLVALFPDLSAAERQGLAAFIAASNEFAFNAIIPSAATTLTDAEIIEQGFIKPPEL